MKRRDLLRQLAALGWVLDRHGGAHDIYRKGERAIPVPRHAEINELTARGILRAAQGTKP